MDQAAQLGHRRCPQPDGRGDPVDQLGDSMKDKAELPSVFIPLRIFRSAIAAILPPTDWLSFGYRYQKPQPFPTSPCIIQIKTNGRLTGPATISALSEGKQYV
jgi:hypothetical protein